MCQGSRIARDRMRLASSSFTNDLVAGSQVSLRRTCQEMYAAWLVIMLFIVASTLQCGCCRDLTQSSQFCRCMTVDWEALTGMAALNLARRFGDSSTTPLLPDSTHPASPRSEEHTSELQSPM